MATYREVKGYSIKSVSSDPANIKEGQIWYNSSTKVIKVAPTISSWSAGGNMNDVSSNSALAMAGTQNAQVQAGGANPSPGLTVEEYDGSSWTTATNMPERFENGTGGGTQTAGLFCGGDVPAAEAGGPAPAAQTESFEYDGTNWTAGGDLNTDRTNGGGCGTQTAGLTCGGRQISPSNDPGSVTANTEEYDGSSWTESGDMSTGRFDTSSMCGTQTAAVFFGGRPKDSGSGLTNVEEYNGTSWTAGEAFPEGRVRANASGTQTLAIVFNGQSTAGSQPTNKTTTFSYDGTDFSADAALGTARYAAAGGGGTKTAALNAGGYAPGTAVNTSEEYSSAATTRSVDVS